MTDLTETIARLRELEAKATPAPWSFSAKSETDEGVLTGPDGVDLRKIDAKLMAALRNALPALLDAAERAEFMAACGQMDIDKRIAAEAERDRLAARVAELEEGIRLSRGLLEAVRDNDPNDMAADAVPVHTVWRSEARRILTLPAFGSKCTRRGVR